MHKYFLLESLVKNVGTAVADGLSFGIASGLKNSWKEIAEHTRTTNEALYYLQVKTFLETIDLDQEQVTQFFENNHDHQRLGIEIFKILEQTHLEKQSEMIARAFQLLTSGEIERKKLDQILYVITNLNQYLLNTLEDYLPDEVITSKKFNLKYEFIGLDSILPSTDTSYSQQEISYDRKLSSFLNTQMKNVPQELINFGFYEPIAMILYVGAENLPQQEYKPTRFFIWFITHIFKNKV
ncbi:hypothetical protein [Acinetobacter ursingii]|uniref:hypothetical protein n=1 Tax=Acinetobacter ursingii TaxID=108980 RepID=UPI0021CDA619|nr:hypothetical protein [Acinetobacter ursingii]MCU4350904.1 hypothetical protein [Acinetobacter ursingii]